MVQNTLPKEIVSSGSSKVTPFGTRFWHLAGERAIADSLIHLADSPLWTVDHHPYLFADGWKLQMCAPS